jgi:hypothetical protein
MVHQCELDISVSGWGPKEGPGVCGNDFWIMVTYVYVIALSISYHNFKKEAYSE